MSLLETLTSKGHIHSHYAMDAELSIPQPKSIGAGRSAVALACASRFRWVLQVAQALLVVGIAASSYLFVSHFVVQSVRVTGASMQPTLRNGQTCLLNRWIYRVRAPRVGDVVVLRDPTDNGLAVKRIVGVAGDEIELRADGVVYRNQEPARESYLQPGTRTYPGPRFKHQTLVCPEGKFVVFGDNRANSTDSRNYGAVSRENILGMIVP